MNKPESKPDFPANDHPLLRQIATSGNHPAAALLRASAEGVLPADTDSAIRSHLANCAACASLQADLMKLEPLGPSPDQQRRIRARIIEERRAGRGWAFPWRAALIGAVAVLIALAFVLTHKTRLQPVRLAIAVSKAPIEIPATMLPMRGAPEPGQPNLQRWTVALKPYKDGDFPAAIETLQQITGDYPRFADAHFYLGVSQLMLGKNADASIQLARARELSSGDRRIEAGWYLGVADARLGRTAEAAGLWQSVCSAGGAYSTQACNAIQRLKSAHSK